MNLKYLLFVLSILLISLSLVLLFRDDTPLSLKTSSSIHSYKKTSDTEYFHIQLLSNKKDAYYFIIDEVVSSSITNQEDIIPLELKSIQKSETTTGEYIIDLSFKIGFDSEEYLIDFSEAYLNITYNDKELTVYIGEFYYLFSNTDYGDISLINLEATYDDILDIRTVSGLLLTVRNNSYHNLIIKDIEILSTSVDVMNEEVFVLEEDIDNFMKVSDILDKQFDPFDYENSDITITLLQDEETTLFGPLIYNGEINYIHRFSIKITYLLGGEERIYYIDDFPFMRESIFQTEYQDYINEYIFD